jgi:hypothetical protein
MLGSNFNVLESGAIFQLLFALKNHTIVFSRGGGGGVVGTTMVASLAKTIKNLFSRTVLFLFRFLEKKSTENITDFKRMESRHSKFQV